MPRSNTLKPDDQTARSYADRLILAKLTELREVIKPGEIAEKLSNSGMGLAAVRSLLASNPTMFAYNERRWVPASRMETMGRPLNFAAIRTVDRFGGPMPIRLVAQELAATRDDDVEKIEVALRRTAAIDEVLFATYSDELALSTWVFKVTDETIERALALEDLELESVQEVITKLGDFDWRSDDAIHEALEKLAPINAKLVGAAAWMSMNSTDPKSVLIYDWRSFNSELLSAEGFVFSSSGAIYPAETTRKWISAAVRLAEKLEPSVEFEETAPLELKPDDVANMVRRIVQAPQTVTATRLLEELFEITPSVRTFPDDMRTVMEHLREAEQVWWVGGDRFRTPDSAPDYIYSVPEPFDFVRTDFRNEDGDRIDVELTDEGLSTMLRKLLSHPLAMDVNDEELLPPPKQPQEQLRLVLKPIHRELGTFPMCQIAMGWLEPAPNIQELIFVDPDGRELQVWANHDARLIFNLLDWWLDQPVESGAVFNLTKTKRPNVFEFEWLDQTDPIVYISSQRMEELRDIALRADEMSTFDVLREVMTHFPKGADFLTILWELNVVRRTSRRLTGSLLSTYSCFYQRSGSPVWHYDAKKAEAGYDKSKRRFMRKEDLGA